MDNVITEACLSGKLRYKAHNFKDYSKRVLKVYKWYLSVAHFLLPLVKDFQYKKRRMLTRHKYSFREIADSRYTTPPASADTIGAKHQGTN